jgi:hypothetical protein
LGAVRRGARVGTFSGGGRLTSQEITGTGGLCHHGWPVGWRAIAMEWRQGLLSTFVKKPHQIAADQPMLFSQMLSFVQGKDEDLAPAD